jgi:hypothetical protein
MSYDPKLTALARLLLQHADEQDKQTLITVIRNMPLEPKKVKKPSEPKAKATAKPTGERVYGLSLPEQGTLDAAGFIKAIQNAGKRPFKTRALDGSDLTVIKVEQSQVRNDSIKAIVAYIGYDTRGSFGEQEQKARSQASIALGYRKTNGQTRTEARQSFQHNLNTGKSVVSADPGLNDHNAKVRTHLQAQETQLVGNIIDLEKVVENPRLSLAEREMALELCELNRARLEHIKSQLVAIANGSKYVQTVE